MRPGSPAHGLTVILVKNTSDHDTSRLKAKPRGPAPASCAGFIRSLTTLRLAQQPHGITCWALTPLPSLNSPLPTVRRSP